MSDAELCPRELVLPDLLPAHYNQMTFYFDISAQTLFHFYAHSKTHSFLAYAQDKKRRYDLVVGSKSKLVHYLADAFHFPWRYPLYYYQTTQGNLKCPGYLGALMSGAVAVLCGHW